MADGPNQFQEQLKSTIDGGADYLRKEQVGAGISYVLRQSEVFSGEERDDFRDQARFGIAQAGLWDEAVDPEASMLLLDGLPSTVGWANSLANTGKYLAQEGPFVERGQEALRRSATMFKQAYASMSDAPLSHRAEVLIEDYFRVAGLQDEAGDKEGMRETTRAIVPHMVALTEELNEVEDAYDRTTLEDTLKSVIQCLGSLESDDAQTMFKNIHNETFKRTLLVLLQEKFARDLVAVGEIDNGLAIMAANGNTPLSLWNEAADLWRDGEHETVQRFVDGVGETFPDYYSECGGVVINMTPMVEVLAAADRDDLLRTVFMGMLANGEDTSELKRFAYSCGVNGAGERLKSVAQPLDLSKEMAAEVYGAYQMGVDAHTTQKEEASESS